MGAYKYIAETLQRQYKERDLTFRAKIILWRSGPVIAKVEYPSNLNRARRLGYKAKQGYLVVRVRIEKGRRTRRKSMGGRKHKNYYRFVQPGMSHQAMAEQRVNRLYRNMEVLNSYWVGEDGNYKYFEVILADPTKPSVNVSSVMRQGKSFRGLTSAGNSGRPNKKKSMNKKLRRKKMRKPYHYAPYVKKEASGAEVVKPREKPKVKKTEQNSAHHPHEKHANEHVEHTEHKPHHETAKHTKEPAEGKPAAHHESQHKPAHAVHPKNE